MFSNTFCLFDQQKFILSFSKLNKMVKNIFSDSGWQKTKPLTDEVKASLNTVKTQIISAMQHISVAENNLFLHDNILFRLSTAHYILPPVILSYFNVISRFLSFTLMYSTDIKFFG